MIKKSVVVCAGWLAGIATVVVFYSVASQVPSLVAGAAFLLAGLGVGAVCGRLPWIAQAPGAFAFASFVGAMMALAPVILTTYGFALVVLGPVVALWSGAVRFGMSCSNRLRSNVVDNRT